MPMFAIWFSCGLSRQRNARLEPAPVVQPAARGTATRSLRGLHRRVASAGRDRRRGAGDHLGAAAGPAAGGSVVRAAWVPVAALQDAAAAGDAKAQQIIAPYRMHCDAPNDPGAFALCDAVADEWPAARRAAA